MTEEQKPNNPYIRMTNLADARLGAEAITQQMISLLT